MSTRIYFFLYLAAEEGLPSPERRWVSSRGEGTTGPTLSADVHPRSALTLLFSTLRQATSTAPSQRWTTTRMVRWHASSTEGTYAHPPA